MNKTYSYGKQTIKADDIRAVVSVLKSDWLTQGPWVSELEQKLADYTGAKFAVAVANGTAALHLAMLAVDIGPGDEVITSTLTFVASANCARYCGADVVLCDIDPQSGLIDLNQLEKKITQKTKVIVPVDYAGQPVDLDKVKMMAKKHHLLVVEDAAHSIGSQYKGKRIGGGNWADMTTLSFHPVKNMTTGEGGAILTNSKKLYEKLLMLRTHGIVHKPTLFVTKDKKMLGPWWYEMQTLGFNYRMTDIQAALGISQLAKLDKFITRRQKIVAQYRTGLAGDDRFSLITELPYSKAAFHLCPLLLNLPILKLTKQQIYDELIKKGIKLQVHYIPIHLQPYYQKLGFKQGDFPIAEDFYLRELSLPLYPSLSVLDINKIIKTLQQVVQ